MTQPFTIVFAVFPNVTQLDFTGPFEVLRRLPGARPIVASRVGGELVSDSGLAFASTARLSQIEACDLLCVPGGTGVTAALRDREFIAELRRLAQNTRYLTSVCSGSLLLAATGLIDGKRSACHWAWRDLLAEYGVIADAGRVVRDGNLISGAGVTAGIDLALALVAELAGVEQAQSIQLSIEYDPDPPFGAGRPETAPAPLAARLREQVRGGYPERRAALAEARAAWRDAAS